MQNKSLFCFCHRVQTRKTPKSSPVEDLGVEFFLRRGWKVSRVGRHITSVYHGRRNEAEPEITKRKPNQGAKVWQYALGN